MNRYMEFEMAYSNALSALHEDLFWEALCLEGFLQVREKLRWLPTKRALRRQGARAEAARKTVQKWEMEWEDVMREVTITTEGNGRRITIRREKSIKGR